MDEASNMSRVTDDEGASSSSSLGDTITRESYLESLTSSQESLMISQLADEEEHIREEEVKFKTEDWTFPSTHGPQAKVWRNATLRPATVNHLEPHPLLVDGILSLICISDINHRPY